MIFLLHLFLVAKGLENGTEERRFHDLIVENSAERVTEMIVDGFDLEGKLSRWIGLSLRHKSLDCTKVIMSESSGVFEDSHSDFCKDMLDCGYGMKIMLDYGYDISRLKIYKYSARVVQYILEDDFVDLTTYRESVSNWPGPSSAVLVDHGQGFWISGFWLSESNFFYVKRLLELNPDMPSGFKNDIVLFQAMNHPRYWDLYFSFGFHYSSHMELVILRCCIQNNLIEPILHLAQYHDQQNIDYLASESNSVNTSADTIDTLISLGFNVSDAGLLEKYVKSKYCLLDDLGWLHLHSAEAKKCFPVYDQDAQALLEHLARSGFNFYPYTGSIFFAIAKSLRLNFTELYFQVAFDVHSEAHAALDQMSRQESEAFMLKFVEMGGDVFGLTEQLLMFSIHFAYVEAIKVLLNTGVDLHFRSNEALLYSVVRGSDCTIGKLLLDQGADPNARGGQIVATCLSQSKYLSMLALILKRGGDLSTLQNCKTTPNIIKWLSKHPLYCGYIIDIMINLFIADSCCICLTGMKLGESVVGHKRNGLDHYFHAHCMFKWLRKSQTCPTCRQPLILMKD